MIIVGLIVFLYAVYMFATKIGHQEKQLVLFKEENQENYLEDLEMKELRKQVFKALRQYVETVVDIKKDAEKTGVFDDTDLHSKQAEINEILNQKFDEAEERTHGKRKGGFFSK